MVCTYPGNLADAEQCGMCSAPKPVGKVRPFRFKPTTCADQCSNTQVAEMKDSSQTPSPRPKLPVGGTLARLQKETRLQEENTIDQQRKMRQGEQGDELDNYNEWNFWKLAPPSIDEVLGLEVEEQTAQENAVRRAKEEEEEKVHNCVQGVFLSRATERNSSLGQKVQEQEERKDSFLRGRHEKRIAEVVKMFLEQSQAAQRFAPTGNEAGLDYFQGLPDEVVAYIFSFVLNNLSDCTSVYMTCKQVSRHP